MYSHERRWKTSKAILYNNVLTEALYGAFIDPNKIAIIGGERRILAGTFLAAGGELLKRACLISATAGDGKLFVNNPYPFAVGDILRVIGSPTPDPIGEYQAVVNGTAPLLGTISAIASDGAVQTTRVSLNNLNKGNILSLFIEGLSVLLVAPSDSVKTCVALLKDELFKRRNTLSILDEVEVVATDTALLIKSLYPGEIFNVWGYVQQGSAQAAGTMTIEVAQGVAQIMYTPAQGAPTTLPAGTKVGTINQIPLGVIAHDYYLQIPDGPMIPADLSAYNRAAIYKHALPYLDGHLVQALPMLSYMPVYGDPTDAYGMSSAGVPAPPVPSPSGNFSVLAVSTPPPPTNP